MKLTTVKRPAVDDVVRLNIGDARVVAVHEHGRVLEVDAPNRGAETVERVREGWWTTVRPRAWAAWHQGTFRSLAAARREAREWHRDPDKPAEYASARLWIIPHGSRRGYWRLVNCGNRGPGVADVGYAPFYGPITAENV
jgi:hypothetical protein